MVNYSQIGYVAVSQVTTSESSGTLSKGALCFYNIFQLITHLTPPVDAESHSKYSMYTFESKRSNVLQALNPCMDSANHVNCQKLRD